MEEAIITTLNKSNDFSPSEGWLGTYSTEEEIRNSGMWLKKGLDAQPLSIIELQWLKDRLKASDQISEFDLEKTHSEPPAMSGTKISTSNIQNYFEVTRAIT